MTRRLQRKAQPPRQARLSTFNSINGNDELEEREINASNILFSVAMKEKSKGRSRKEDTMEMEKVRPSDFNQSEQSARILGCANENNAAE